MRIATLSAIALAFILFFSFFGCAQSNSNEKLPPLQPYPAYGNTGDNIAKQNATSTAKVAANGDTVSVNYIGKLTNGSLFDTSIREEAVKAGFALRPSYEPLTFKVGAGQMIAGFDAGVVGMKEGEEKVVTLPPEQAYGEKNDKMVFSVPLANIGNSSTIKVGSMLYSSNGAAGKVVAVNATDAQVDFNHELAGQTLVFTIRMVSIQKK